MNRIYKLLICLLFLVLPLLFSQGAFEDYLKQQQQAQNQFFEEEEAEFKNYVASVTAEYDQYEEQQKKEFEDFKKNVEQKWSNFKSPSKKEYVEYDSDLNSRASVDFERGEVTIEVIIEDEPAVQKPITKGLRKNTKKIKEIVKNKNNNTKPIKNSRSNTLENSLSKKKAMSQQKIQEKLVNVIKTKGVNGNPILKDQLVDKKGKSVSTRNAKKYAAQLVSSSTIKQKSYKSKDGKTRTVYTVKVPMKPDHISTRAKEYKKEVLKQSKRFNIDPIIAFAVMETESAFNPKAKSHIPAYGLMQLVPKSGARDAYLFVYKKDKFVGGDYLFRPSNNIELGCAYLSKIRHQYFKSIKDDEKAYICAIPAYNTGIGNVAKALTGKTKLKPASMKANSLTPKQLYNKLHKDLKYKEARDYLERVWTKKDKYSKMLN
jgi:membrane-bound lytic murein transglycosylase C